MRQDATIVMLINWFCGIFDFVINFSPPSFLDGVESKDGLRLGVIGSYQLNDGVLGICAPSVTL